MTTENLNVTPSESSADEKNQDLNHHKGANQETKQLETKANENVDEAKKPTDEEAKLLKEVMKLKEERKKHQQELSDLKSRYGNATPEEVKELIQKRKDEETKALEAKGEYERIKQQLVEEHNKSLKDRDDEINSLKQQLLERDTIIGNLTIGAEFGKSKFITDELIFPPNKARELYGSYFDIVDGVVVGYDKPKGHTERTMLVNSQGNPLSFDEAMSKIISFDPDRDSITKSKLKSGANSTEKPKTGSIDDKRNSLSSLEKIQKGLNGFK